MVMAAQDFVTDMVVDDEALAECRWLCYVDGYGSTGFCYRYGGG